MKSFNWGHSNPEKALSRQEDHIPFSERRKGLDASFIESLIDNAKLIDDIRKNGYPTDEIICDEIGKQHGLGPEQIAEASKRLREEDQRNKKVH